MELSEHETSWLQSNGAKMLTNLGVKQGNNVIDFGCGEGRYSIPLSQIVKEPGCVYSVECDEKTISILQEKLALFSDPNIVKLLKTDTLEFSNVISNKSIDFILVFDVLQHIKDWNLLFSNLFNLLKSGGIICVYPAAIPHPGEVDIELVKLKMEKIGFKFTKSIKYNMMHSIDMVEDIVYVFNKD